MLKDLQPAENPIDSVKAEVNPFLLPSLRKELWKVMLLPDWPDWPDWPRPSCPSPSTSSLTFFCCPDYPLGIYRK